MSTTTPPESITDASRSWRAPGRLMVWWLAMASSFIAYVAGRVVEGGAVSTLSTMIGTGACGWAWLISRALFDPARQDALWPRIVVFVVAVSGAISVLDLGGPTIGRVIDNTYALSGSAVLLLTFVEPFHRWRGDLRTTEKRFRVAFVVIYALLVAVSILAPGGAEASADETRRIDAVKSVCALVGLVAGTAAVWFRLRNPLIEAGPSRAMRRAPTDEDKRIADRILRLLQQERVHAEPNLKVADLAARLGQPEYRISHAISAGLGFENFNRMINHHRVEQAKELLLDADRRSILDVAFDCGFGSVGPFNRAFKAETGTTPRAYRREAALASRIASNSLPAVQAGQSDPSARSRPMA